MSEHKYGPKGHIVDAFIEHLNGMTDQYWSKFYAARYINRDAQPSISRDTARHIARKAAKDAGLHIAGYAVRSAAHNAKRDAGRSGAWDAANEIQGADLLRERGHPFVFLPMFGFANEQAIIKHEQL